MKLVLEVPPSTSYSGDINLFNSLPMSKLGFNSHISAVDMIIFLLHTLIAYRICFISFSGLKYHMYNPKKEIQDKKNKKIERKNTHLRFMFVIYKI